MNDKRKVLGRGLDSLLPRAVPAATNVTAINAAAEVLAGGELVREIPLEEIERNPYQTRSHLDEVALGELAASIAAQGVLQPIVVRYIGGKYQLIAGERRWLASRRAGRLTIPALVRPVSNETALELTIVENLQREDLNPIDEAHGFERLGREFGLTQEQMADRTGKDRATIANFLRLLRLPPEVQAMVADGSLSMGHAKALMRVDVPSLMVGTARHVADKGMSVRETEAFVAKMVDAAVDAAAQEPKPPKPVDPNVRAAIRELEQRLGVRVEIKDRKGKGKVILSYNSLEDFDRIVEALAGK